MFKKLLRWVAFLFGGILIILLIFAIIGSIYQRQAEIHDRQEYPPGQFVNLGDHQMHLHCTGSGSPTVILESGSINTYLTWTKVQPEVAEFTQVCSYDRAGLGWSSPIDEPQRSYDIAKWLYQLLKDTGLDRYLKRRSGFKVLFFTDIIESTKNRYHEFSKTIDD